MAQKEQQGKAHLHTLQDRGHCHLCALQMGQWVPQTPNSIPLPLPHMPHRLCPIHTRLLPFTAAAPSFADMGNAIGSLIMLGKGGVQEEEEDSVLLPEEHSLILTCCWVSVKVSTLLHSTGKKSSLAQHPPPSPPYQLVLQLPLGHSPSLGRQKDESLPLPWSCQTHPHPLPRRM